MTQTSTPPAVKPSRVEPPRNGEQTQQPDEHGIPTDLAMPSGTSIAVAVGAFVLLLIELYSGRLDPGAPGGSPGARGCGSTR